MRGVGCSRPFQSWISSWFHFSCWVDVLLLFETPFLHSCLDLVRESRGLTTSSLVMTRVVRICLPLGRGGLGAENGPWNISQSGTCYFAIRQPQQYSSSILFNYVVGPTCLINESFTSTIFICIIFTSKFMWRVFTLHKMSPAFPDISNVPYRQIRPCL
jgi:hypothetical protein